MTLNFALGGSVLLSLLAPAFTRAAVAQTPLNPTLKIGVVQRFGEKKTDKLMIQAMPGDQLTLEFPSQGKAQTITANQVEFDIQMKPFSEPQTTRQVVISTHRSFESAEAKGNELRTLGLQVELAQPDQWQVWGKRSFYVTEQNQLWLLNQVKARGFPNAFIAQKTRTEKPQLSWTSNGFRYHRDAVKIKSGTGQFKVNSDRFAGTLNFQKNAYGTYTLVNQVPIETYLRGVVPYEIGPQAPDAAIQAQSIIARTYALRNLRRFKIDDYELCATTQCQVYKGLDAATPRVDRAIAATQGQVLTYNNELVDALYSSTTGGVTARFEDVWEGQTRPYLQAKIDAVPNQVWDLTTRPLSEEANFRSFINLKKGFNEETWNHFRWSRDSSLAQVNQELKQFLTSEKHPLANFNQVSDIQVTQRSPGGRVQQLSVTTDLGTVQLTKDEILRALEGPNSLLFYVQRQTEPAAPPEAAADPRETGDLPPTLKGFTFIGGGLGHAVGLSQTGSYRLSDLGYSAEQILKFYYPGTQVQPLTTSVVYWRDPLPSAAIAAQPPAADPIPAQPIPTAPVASPASKPASTPEKPAEKPAAEFLGIKLPTLDFSVLWEWIPFF